MSSKVKAVPGGTPSIIGADLTIRGNMKTAGDIQLDGTLIGDVHSQSLTVGEQARIEGAVNSNSLKVSGAVVGNLEADQVVLTKSARVEGDVTHDSLEIEMGAEVEGRMHRRKGAVADLAAIADNAPSADDHVTR